MTREGLRKFTPLLLAWLAVHAIVLSILALAFGLAVVLRAVAGWLLHFGAIIVLAVLGIWLALRFGRAGRGVSRAA
jgi:hypothetical protein